MMRALFLLFLLSCPTQGMRPVAQKILQCELAPAEAPDHDDWCGQRFNSEVQATKERATDAATFCEGVSCVCPEGVIKPFVLTQRCGAKDSPINFGGCAIDCTAMKQHITDKYARANTTRQELARMKNDLI